MRLLGLLLLVVGCSASRAEGCDASALAGYDGWTFYSCPHPFPSQRAALEGKNCSAEAWRRGPAYGWATPCGWTDAVTDCSGRAVYVQWGHGEALGHELRHVRACMNRTVWEH